MRPSGLARRVASAITAVLPAPKQQTAAIRAGKFLARREKAGFMGANLRVRKFVVQRIAIEHWESSLVGVPGRDAARPRLIGADRDSRLLLAAGCRLHWHTGRRRAGAALWRAAKAESVPPPWRQACCLPGNAASSRLPPDYLLLMRMAAASSPSEVAVSLMVPGSPALARTMTSARPLKAFRSGAWKDSKLVASPLSVATISPGPSIWNWMWFFERGTSRPFLSATVTVMKERSWPSVRILSRSACSVSFAAGPVVFMTSVAHFLPFFQATTLSSPG